MWVLSAVASALRPMVEVRRDEGALPTSGAIDENHDFHFILFFGRDLVMLGFNAVWRRKEGFLNE